MYEYVDLMKLSSPLLFRVSCYVTGRLPAVGVIYRLLIYTRQSLIYDLSWVAECGKLLPISCSYKRSKVTRQHTECIGLRK